MLQPLILPDCKRYYTWVKNGKIKADYCLESWMTLQRTWDSWLITLFNDFSLLVLHTIIEKLYYILKYRIVLLWYEARFQCLLAIQHGKSFWSAIFVDIASKTNKHKTPPKNKSRFEVTPEFPCVPFTCYMTVDLTKPIFKNMHPNIMH